VKKRLFGEVVDDLTDKDLQFRLTEDELFGLFGLRPPQSRVKQTTVGGAPRDVDLGKVTPQEFEHLVSRLYSRMGYLTKVTRFSKDGGIDIRARKLTEANRENLIIQCKHYPQGTVGVEPARALNGLLTQEFSGGVLITSGRFSAECKEFCCRTRIHLIDGPELLRLLDKHHAG